MKIMVKQTILAVGLAGAITAVVGCDKRYNVDDPFANERTPGQAVDDKALTSNVKEALDKDSLKYPDLRVSTYGGVVQLSGFVDTEEQKQRAGEIAQNVPGVSKVDNAITVKDERNQ